MPRAPVNEAPALRRGSQPLGGHLVADAVEARFVSAIDVLIVNGKVDVADPSGERVRRVYTEADVFEAVVDGLANGVEYTVTVSAVPSHGGENGRPSEARTATPGAGGEPKDVPVPALPLAGAGVLAGLLASAAYRLRRAGPP